MITREQIQDLREGDVVELGFSSGAIVRGPLVEDRHVGGLDIAEAGWSVRQRDGGLPYGLERIAETLTVVSRAPRPLYVNHARTEPVAGDVVRDELGNKMALFICTEEEEAIWWVDTAADWIAPAEMREKRLRLLVDGENGQVVQ